MASPLARGISTAIKRTRSQDSLGRSGTPVPKASKTDEASETPSEPPSEPEEPSLPAFLRQSRVEINAKFIELNWQEKIRISQGRKDPNSNWAQDVGLQTLQRNRYLGVQPWDKSRIKLKVGEGTSDYINASPISLVNPATGQETKYIATQGPKKSSVGHFWHMIWHETEEVAVIVMLTPTEEAGREKCFQYFPADSSVDAFKIDASGHPEDSVEGEVAFVEMEDGDGSYTQVRKLRLTFGTETKTVWHLLFTAFPDFSVPEADDRAELLRLLTLSAQKNSRPGNPRTIHCSAGVGRSGTFIALEYLLSLLEAGRIASAKADEDPIFDLVHQLREQRMMMVQSDSQYQFLYDVIAEEFEKKQALSLLLEQPSPKLRKLNDGMKAAALDDLDDIEHAETVQNESDERVEKHTGNQEGVELNAQADGAPEGSKADQGVSVVDIREMKRDESEDTLSPWSSFERPFLVISGIIIALLTSVFGAFFHKSTA